MGARRGRRFGIGSEYWLTLELATEQRLARIGRSCNSRRGHCSRTRTVPASIRLVVQDLDPITGEPVGETYEVLVCKRHRRWWNADDVAVLKEEQLPPLPDKGPRKFREDGFTSLDERRHQISLRDCNNGSQFGLAPEDEPLCEEPSQYVLTVVWADAAGRQRKGAVPWRVCVGESHLSRWQDSDKVVILLKQTMDDFMDAEARLRAELEIAKSA